MWQAVPFWMQNNQNTLSEFFCAIIALLLFFFKSFSLHSQQHTHKHPPLPLLPTNEHTPVLRTTHTALPMSTKSLADYFAPRLSPPSCFPHSAWLAADSSRVCVCMVRRPDTLTLPCSLSTVCVRDLPSRRAPLGLPDRRHTQTSCRQNSRVYVHTLWWSVKFLF